VRIGSLVPTTSPGRLRAPGVAIQPEIKLKGRMTENGTIWKRSSDTTVYLGVGRRTHMESFV
jgi:hypothetical protein